MFIFKNIPYIILYALNSIFINYLYNLLNIIFNKYYYKYKIITPNHKKIYFVSNIIKGSFLGLLSPLALKILCDYIFFNKWDIYLIRFLSNIYCSLDLVSMFKVEKMQINTVIHHSMVQFMYMYSLVVCDFNEKTLANPIVIYAIFSTFAFIVNLYLSFRLTLSDCYLKKMATLSSIIYHLCCAFNWFYQLYYLYIENIPIIYKIIYILLILSIVGDDLVLIKFLNKNSYLVK